MNKRVLGKCALCREICELSFEHIPPKAAFNLSPVKPVSGEKLLSDDRMPWDVSGLKYKNQQQGMGMFSLCEQCNNNTGSWYGNDYTIIARCLHSALSESMASDENGIGIRHIYPLRFVKQVISMFCSINNFDDPRINKLREFVLNRYTVGLDQAEYKLCMYFTKSKFMKYAPLSAVLRTNENRIECIALSEITAYPLGFVLYFNPTETWHYDGIDITHFSNCKYEDEATIEFPLCIKEMNDILPVYYRSQDEIKRCIDENKKIKF